MFGRRVCGSALILVAVAGLIGSGCGEKPTPTPPEPTALEKAQTALDEAKLLLADGRLDEAAQKVEEAKTHEADLPEIAKVTDDIQAAREKAAAKGREAKIQALAKEAQDLLAQDDLGAAEEKAKEILAMDAANQAAKDVLAKVTQKRADVVAGETAARREKERLEAQRREKARLETQRTEKARLETQRRKRVEEEAAKRRRYDDAMRAGQSQETAGQLADARRSYEKARREALNGRARRRAESAIARVRRHQDYKNAMDEGERALARGDYDGALARLTQARSLRRTPEVEKKLDEVRAVKAEADGDNAVAAGDYATAVAKFEEAQAVRATAELGDKLDKAKAAKTRADYIAKVKAFEAEKKVGRFSAITSQLDALAKQFPQWPEAKRLLKAGPLKAEVDKINKAAEKAWTLLNAKLKKIPPKRHTDKIAAIETAMLNLRFSKREKAAVKMLKREKDAVLQGAFTKVDVRAKKLKGQAKIDYLTGELDAFKGSGHHDKLSKAIETERTALKTKAYNALKPKVAKAKTPADKIKILEGSKAGFAGTKYDKMIASQISKQLNIIKGKDYASLRTRIKPLRTSESKIAEYQRSLPNFKGSKYEGIINKLLSKEKTRLMGGKFKSLVGRWKKEKDPKKKIAILEAEAAQFAKTKFERKISAYISKGKKGLEGAMFKNVSVNAKKLKGQKKLDYLTGKLGEFKSKAYQTKIKGMINAAKKTLKADEQKAKDAAAAKVYGDVTAKVKKTKDNEAKKQLLTEALQKVAGTRYVDMIRKQLKALEKKKPAPKKKK